jgi:hypothetical protein
MENLRGVHEECAEKKRLEYQSKPRPEYREGDNVKVAFTTGNEQTEHLWVEVMATQGDEIVGKINNDPVYPTDEIQYGKMVRVGMERVWDYLPKQVEFTRELAREFKRKYESAAKAENKEFVWDSRVYLTSYAKYLVEHLENQFGKL